MCCAVTGNIATKTNARGNECVIEKAGPQFSTALETECGITILHRPNFTFLSDSLLCVTVFCANSDLYSFQVVNYYAKVVKLLLIWRDRIVNNNTNFWTSSAKSWTSVCLKHVLITTCFDSGIRLFV